jgi:NADPH-dependent 2,4-dienoyl-CoA reductase/sulfur reductase-like enzyme
MPDPVRLTVDGLTVSVPAGSMVSTAVVSAGASGFRQSVTGEARGPLCGMGICFECRVTIDGRAHCKSCQVVCAEGMEITVGQAPRDVAGPPAGLPRQLVVAPAGRPQARGPAPQYDTLVIGAGPAGLAAACRAAECGAHVAIIDDNLRPGGQIWRADISKRSSPADAWVRMAQDRSVEVIAGARVFAAPEAKCLAVEIPEGELALSYRNLILATGARERFLPFPGWTLPNVMGAGGLQALAKSGLPVKGKKVIVAGSGPLLLAVARYMKDHGADLRLLAEQADQASLLRFALGLAAHPGKLAQAIGFRAGLLGTRYLTSCWPVSAQGSEKLESVTLHRGGRTWTEPCDYLACGFGLIPNTEVAALLGCAMSQTGVAVNEFQETSVAGVYSAGEATGIGGLDLALAEGEIAGYAAAGKHETAKQRFGARESHRRFAVALERAFALRDELKALAQADTMVCRCEDVTLGRLRQFGGWRDAKLHSRCGMGPCQGRVCGGAVEFVLGWKAASVRPPLFPARVASLRASGE